MSITPDNAPFAPPVRDNTPAFPKVGIYFGMPEDQYHAVPAASSSGIKKLSISSMDYWAASWMNPENDEDEEEAVKDSGKLTPRQLGHAYHSYIVEGEAAFHDRFFVTLDEKELRAQCAAAGAPFCVTIKEIRDAIEDEDVKPKGTVKAKLAEQLIELRSDAIVWDVVTEQHAALNEGKLPIDPKLYRRILIANQMIAADPQLGSAFTGGHAEVSIFWHDPETGVPMKARLDYIKMQHLIDLKSFANQNGKPVQRAIDMAIANYKYFIPVVVYLMAIKEAKRMVRETKGKCVYDVRFNGTDDDGVKQYVTKPAHKSRIEWAWTWAHQEEPEVIFVFQQTGVAPVTRGRIMQKGSTYTINEHAVRFLIRKWASCAKAYGTDPWVDFEAVTYTEDESLPWAATDFGDTQ